MSNKSRHRAATSRGRLTLAAGAVLAGAVIPIAAAGTAWADDDTITVAQAERDAKAGQQVEISKNGVIIKDTCVTCSANSGAVGDHNVAIAIGAGSSAQVQGDVTDSTVKASGGGGAVVEDFGGSEPVSHDTATATNGGEAQVFNDGSSTVPVTHNTAIGNDGQAQVYDGDNSKATAVNTGNNFNALVRWATDSTAKAEGKGSEAGVEGTPSSYITGSSAQETEGGGTVVKTSDTHEVNGMVVPHVEMAPLPDVHVEMAPLTEPHVEMTPPIDVHVMPLP
jgi:hypothetical protein